MELKDGEVVCPECNGQGFPREKGIPYTKSGMMYYPRCEVCLGHGKGHWMDLITGKNIKPLSGRWSTTRWLSEIE